MLSVSNISLEDQTLILINCLIIIPSYFLIISAKYRGEIKINQFYFPSDVQQCGLSGRVRCHHHPSLY